MKTEGNMLVLSIEEVDKLQLDEDRKMELLEDVSVVQ